MGSSPTHFPVPPTGKTWAVTISEVAPDGWVNVVPFGGTYTKTYSAINPVIGGFSFGDQQVATSAEGCAWVDTDGDRQKDNTEMCEAGWTLYATVTDDQGKIVTDGDFVTNTLGTNGKFSYALPIPPTGKDWTVTISEIAPDGWVNVVPFGGTYARNYSAINPVIGGFSFGNQQVSASAEGCAWVDTDGDRQKDDTEMCEAGWMLHATVLDDTGVVVNDENFVTNAAGTNGKFSYALPVPPTGKTWTVTISEAAPDGWVNVVPGGTDPGYTKPYSAINPMIGGFSFGNQQSDGCS